MGIRINQNFDKSIFAYTWDQNCKKTHAAFTV